MAKKHEKLTRPLAYANRYINQPQKFFNGRIRTTHCSLRFTETSRAFFRKNLLSSDHQAVESIIRRNWRIKKSSVQLTKKLDRILHCHKSIKHAAGIIWKLADYISKLHQKKQKLRNCMRRNSFINNGPELLKFNCKISKN